MGTEDWVLKGTKLITNTKKQRLTIQSRGQTLINTIFKKQTKQNHKDYKNIYMKFALKIGSFFFARQETQKRCINSKPKQQSKCKWDHTYQ